MLYTLSLVFSLGLNATASTSFNHSLVNRDIQLNANGVGSITSMYYNYELGKGANDSQIVSSKVNGLYSLVVKRENNSIVSTTESIKQSENLYNTKHTIYGDKNTFFITNCRGQKGKVFNDVICSSINEEVCSAYKKLKGFDRDLFAKVNSCIDIEKKVDAFKNTYKKVIEQDEFKKKHQIGKEEGRIALNKYANVLSLTDVFDKNTGNHMNQEGILEASWNEVNTLVKNCPGIRDDDYYSLNELSVSVESQPHTVKPRKTNTGKK